MIKDAQTVSEFVRDLKHVIQNHPSFNNVTLIGELSNFKAHHSGHFYFSLKDDKSRINCVMFRSKAQSVLFKPKDGDKVILSGACEVFEANGSVQIYATRMNLDGLGDLYIRYDALKKELAQKGYFDAAHKKPIPKFPERIAVIVGENSAAYADISRTLQERWPLAEQIDLLAYVQGEFAVKSIVTQIEKAQNLGVDTILLGRGGGSIEDLWAFNELEVIEAVYNCTIPIVTGIGHESDETISDYVSDYRAATPTAAAVYATPNAKELEQVFRDYKNRYYIAVRNKYLKQTQNLKHIIGSSKLADPIKFVELKQYQLDMLQSRITHQIRIFDSLKRELNETQLNLTNLMNTKIMRREQMLVSYERDFGFYLNQQLTHQKNKYQILDTRLSRITAQLDQKIVLSQKQISQFDAHNITQMRRVLNLKQSRFTDILKVMSSRNPLAIMARGYALTKSNDTLITSAHQVSIDDELTLEFEDGILTSRVIRKDYKNGK